MLKVKHEPWVTALVTRGIGQPTVNRVSERGVWALYVNPSMVGQIGTDIAGGQG